MVQGSSATGWMAEIEIMGREDNELGFQFHYLQAITMEILSLEHMIRLDTEIWNWSAPIDQKKLLNII